MAYLIDSSVFITLERQRRPLGDLALVASSDEPVALAAITASELLVGVHRADTLERRLRRETFVEAVLALLPLIPFDLQVVRVYARVWAELLNRGQLIGSNDLMISATALAHGYAVLTDNLRDFERVRELSIQQPIW